MKEEYKTIREWLMMLKEPYRSEALSNCTKEYLDELCVDISTALLRGFVWELSPQGYDYWKKVRDNTEAHIESEEPKKLPRMVEVRYVTEVWSKRELLADLSSYDIKEPYLCRNSHDPTLATFWPEMREIEEEKKPMSFGEFFTEGYYFPAHLDSAYTSYQEYLKEFKP